MNTVPNETNPVAKALQDLAEKYGKSQFDYAESYYSGRVTYESYRNNLDENYLQFYMECSDVLEKTIPSSIVDIIWERAMPDFAEKHDYYKISDKVYSEYEYALKIINNLPKKVR